MENAEVRMLKNIAKKPEHKQNTQQTERRNDMQFSSYAICGRSLRAAQALKKKYKAPRTFCNGGTVRIVGASSISTICVGLRSRDASSWRRQSSEI